MSITGQQGNAAGVAEILRPDVMRGDIFESVILTMYYGFELAFAV